MNDSKSRWDNLVVAAEREVDQLLRGLPEPVRREAIQVPVICEPRPGRDMQCTGIEPDTLGLFTGTAFPDESSSTFPEPTRIFLFLENILDYADGDSRAFRYEVRRTYMHELGHYLGLDEDDLESRGLE